MLVSLIQIPRRVFAKTRQFMDGALLLMKTQAVRTVEGNGLLKADDVVLCFRRVGFLARPAPHPAPKE